MFPPLPDELAHALTSRTHIACVQAYSSRAELPLQHDELMAQSHDLRASLSRSRIGNGLISANALLTGWWASRNSTIGGTTLVGDLVDRTLIWNHAHHLLHPLREFEIHYNEHRPHRMLRQAAPLRPVPEPMTDQARVAWRSQAVARTAGTCPLSPGDEPLDGQQGGDHDHRDARAAGDGARDGGAGA